MVGQTLLIASALPVMLKWFCRGPRWGGGVLQYAPTPYICSVFSIQVVILIALFLSMPLLIIHPVSGKPQIGSLVNKGILQLGLFETELCEVKDDGVRYVLRRNPVRAEEMGIF